MSQEVPFEFGRQFPKDSREAPHPSRDPTLFNIGDISSHMLSYTLQYIRPREIMRVLALGKHETPRLFAEVLARALVLSWHRQPLLLVACSSASLSAIPWYPDLPGSPNLF